MSISLFDIKTKVKKARHESPNGCCTWFNNGEGMWRGNITVNTNEDVLILYGIKARLNVSIFIFGKKTSIVCQKRSFCANINEIKTELLEHCIFTLL